jgi:hypothetical protein
MAEINIPRMCAKNIPLVAVLVLGLMASVSEAQTPAQDEATVAADKQALEDARKAALNDVMQMNAHQTAGNTAAVTKDAETLATDKQTQHAAADKLQADQQQQSSDDQTFNGTPDSPPQP